MIEFPFLEEFAANKTSASKRFVTIGTFQIRDLSFKRMFAITVMIY